MAPKSEAIKQKERDLVAWVKALPAVVDSDYSQGFSGTKMDTMIEKSYGEILKGVEDVALKDRFPVGPCTCTLDSEGNHGADCEGRWLRVLGKGGCWLYVHTVTHVITGVQPSGYIPDDAKAQDRAKRAAAARGPWPDFPSCSPAGVVDAIRCCHQEAGKTPVLLVETVAVKEAVVAALADAGGLVVSTRPFVLPASRTGIKFEDHFATMIQKITAAVKMGGLVVLDLEDSSPHFLDKLHGAAKYKIKFPEQVWNPRAQGWAKDLALGKPPAPGFGMALMVSLGPKEYEQELKDKVPWPLMKGMRVTDRVPADIVTLSDITKVLEQCQARQRVPLFLDASGREVVDTFLQYQRTQAVDVMQLVSSARTNEERREVLRTKLVSCLKAGDTLLLRLRDGRPDLTPLMADDSFPSTVFSAGQITTQACLDRIYREADKEHGIAVARPGYQLVLTSSQPLETFATALAPGVPVDRLHVVSVEVDDDD